MTDAARLLEIEKRCNEATAGPWGRLHDTPPTVQADEFGEERADGSRPALAIPSDRTCNCAQVWSSPADCPVAYCAVGPDCAPTPEQEMVNAAFIAASRTDVPWLLSKCRGLIAENERLRKVEADHDWLLTVVRQDVEMRLQGMQGDLTAVIEALDAALAALAAPENKR